jgi:hypothetical protein
MFFDHEINNHYVPLILTIVSNINENCDLTHCCPT